MPGGADEDTTSKWERRHQQNLDRFGRIETELRQIRVDKKRMELERKRLEDKVDIMDAKVGKLLELVRTGTLLRRIATWMIGTFLAGLLAWAEWRR